MARGRPTGSGRVSIADPRTTLRIARRVNRKRGAMPLSRACALLEKETGGGRNVFGHDPGGAVVGGAVTRETYRTYLDRVRRGVGRRQGVGPTQLTSAGYQDEADRHGGCWRPNINMYVGFSALAANIKQHGVHGGMRRYNGSGPRAEAYAHDLRAKEAKWRAYFEAVSRAPRPARPAAQPSRRPSLARGDKGHRVVVMTRRLSYLPSRVSGKPYLDGKRTVFDGEAEQALRRFQAEHGLEVSGRFGPRSASTLARAVAAEKKRRMAAVQRPVGVHVGPAGAAPPAAPATSDGGSAELLAELEHLDARGDRVRAALLERHEQLRRALEEEHLAQTPVEGEPPSALGVDELPVVAEQLSRLLQGLATDVRSRVEAELDGERRQRMSADDELRTLIGAVKTNGDHAPAEATAPANGSDAQAGAGPSAELSATPATAGASAVASPPPPSAVADPPQAGFVAPAPPDAADTPGAGPPPAEPQPDEPRVEDLLGRLGEIDGEEHRLRTLLAERYAELEARLMAERGHSIDTETEPPAEPAAEPAAGTGLPPQAPPGEIAVEALQRSLNRFTSKYLRGVAPLPVNGTMSKATAKRIRLVKFYLGYGAKADSSVKPLFLRRMRHPHSREHSNAQMLTRAARRRRAQRARHAGNRLTAAGTVHALQRSLNRFTSKYLRGVEPLQVDGALGPETRRRVVLVKFYLGYGKRDSSVKPRFVRRLRHPHSKRYSSAQMLARAARRRKAQRKRAAKSGTLGQRSLAIARSLVGVMEHGSNAGPVVSKIIRENGGVAGRDAWCGHFVAYCYRHAGSTVVENRWAGVRFLGGLAGHRRVSDPRPGDIVVFPAGLGHTGLFVRHIPGGIETIEGNTSAQRAVSPSKPGGEGVYVKHRSTSEVGRYVRVTR